MTNPLTNQSTDQQTDLDQLAYTLEQAKAEEERARGARIAAETALLDAIGVEGEGSKTHKTSYYKITAKSAINRTIDRAVFEQVQANAPDRVIESVFRLKPELNLSAYKELQKLDPAMFAIVATCVTEKPGKPSVSIERITD